MSNFISKQDSNIFLILFNRNGYVLNFPTTSSFNTFTTNSIGIPLCTKYHDSKGKSLAAYLNEASDEDRTKLLLDLFEYYEEHMEYEFNKDYEDVPWRESSEYNEQYAKLYNKCKSIINSLKGVSSIIQNTADNLKEKFSSEYLSQQMDLMFSLTSTSPTDAIGKAKELIESCCKTILEKMSIPWDRNDDVPQLTSKVLKALDLLPDNILPTDQGAESVKALLGNLRAIPTKLAELRNPFGSGHGKSASYIGLEERHAKLAVGCSITFVDFIWSTYEKSTQMEDF